MGSSHRQMFCPWCTRLMFALQHRGGTAAPSRCALLYGKNFLLCAHLQDTAGPTCVALLQGDPEKAARGYALPPTSGLAMQCSRADHNAVSICVEPVSRTNPYALDTYCAIAYTLIALFCRQRHGSQSTYANGRGFELGHIPNTAINQQTSPMITGRRCGEISANQRMAQRRAAIDYQNTAVSRRVHRLLHQGVVFMALYRADNPAKNR